MRFRPRALFALSCSVLASCGNQSNVASPNADNQITNSVAELTPQQKANQVCASQSTYDTLKEMLFDGVVKQYVGDPVPINNFRHATTARMEYPLVKDINNQLQRTDCSGRLTIDVPAGWRDAFGGESKLEADIQYSIQPSADGSGDVITGSGLGFIQTRIISAASFFPTGNRAVVNSVASASSDLSSDDTGVVTAFYNAMGSGDGAAASELIVPEKRLKGNFTAESLSKLHSMLVGDFNLVEVRQGGPSIYLVHYKYETSGTSCDGHSIVYTVNRNGSHLIQRIKALNGC